MTLREFAELVIKLRTAQKNYFRTREPRYLLEAKQWEKDVDKLAAEIVNGKQESLL